MKPFKYLFNRLKEPSSHLAIGTATAMGFGFDVDAETGQMAVNHIGAMISGIFWALGYFLKDPGSRE